MPCKTKIQNIDQAPLIKLVRMATCNRLDDCRDVITEAARAVSCGVHFFGSQTMYSMTEEQKSRIAAHFTTMATRKSDLDFVLLFPGITPDVEAFISNLDSLLNSLHAGRFKAVKKHFYANVFKGHLEMGFSVSVDFVVCTDSKLEVDFRANLPLQKMCPRIFAVMEPYIPLKETIYTGIRCGNGFVLDFSFTRQEIISKMFSFFEPLDYFIAMAVKGMFQSYIVSGKVLQCATIVKYVVLAASIKAQYRVRRQSTGKYMNAVMSAMTYFPNLVAEDNVSDLSYFFWKDERSTDVMVPLYILSEHQLYNIKRDLRHHNPLLRDSNFMMFSPMDGRDVHLPAINITWMVTYFLSEIYHELSFCSNNFMELFRHEQVSLRVVHDVCGILCAQYEHKQDRVSIVNHYLARLVYHVEHDDDDHGLRCSVNLQNCEEHIKRVSVYADRLKALSSSAQIESEVSTEPSSIM
jgi:hypothetical protein